MQGMWDAVHGLLKNPSQLPLSCKRADTAQEHNIPVEILDLAELGTEFPQFSVQPQLTWLEFMSLMRGC
jgi:hypothetical protein